MGTTAGLRKSAFDSRLAVCFHVSSQALCPKHRCQLCTTTCGTAAQPVPSATLIPGLALSVLPGSAGVSWLGVCPSEPLILRREPSDRRHPGVPAWEPVRNQRQTGKEGCRIPDVESLIHFLVIATCSPWPYGEA